MSNTSVDYRLPGQIALVTGGSRGIGRAICLALSRAGATVIVNYARDEAAADETLAAVLEQGGCGRTFRADITVPAEVDAMVKAVAKEYGRIDILVNNAGVLSRSFLMMTPDVDFKQVIDANLNGTFHCLKSVSRVMIGQKRGTVLNVSSLAGTRGLAGQAAYAASKGAVNSLTVVAANELATYGIRVNAIAPGCIDAGMINELKEEQREEYRKRIPLRRLGGADEVAQVAMFLVSEASSYVTGHVLMVDGGMLIT